MAKRDRTQVLPLGWLIGLGMGGLVGAPQPVLAQIVPDNTLGAERSQVSSDFVRGLPAELITGGAARRSALFHSFSTFNVGEGQRVYFANPIGIENILTRVTGSDPSSILGTLGVNGGANLFLLNPQGILFGPNARLDVAGSFLASTAERFTFADGSGFSAVNPQAAPLLTVNLRPGLQYGANATGQITNFGNLTAGQDLTLAATNLAVQGQLQAGGDLTLRALDTVRVRDSVTNPVVVAAGGQLVVQGDRAIDIFALNHPQSGLLSGGDMVLRSTNRVGGDAHYWAGGNFRVEKLDGSLGGLFSPNDPVIRAAGDVAFDFYEGQSLHIFAGGSVVATEYIWIQGADQVTGLPAESVVLNGSATPININGQQEPTLDIRAGTLAVNSPFGLTGTNGRFGTILTDSTPPAPSRADIRVGSIIFAAAANSVDGITAPLTGKVLLTNQYQPNPALQGDVVVTLPATLQLPQSLRREAIVIGDFDSGGVVELHSKGNITINGNVSAYPLPIFTGVVTGNGGDVTLRADGNITLSPDSAIVTRGIVGGEVTLTSKNGDIRLDRNQINSNSSNSDRNGFSTIRIESDNGSVFINQSNILAENPGTKFAGDIFIDARNRIEINESKILARGRFGRIFVGANTSTPENDSTSPQVIVIDNSSIETTNRVPNDTAFIDVAGFSGKIILRAESAFLSNGSEVSADTYGTDGKGGGDITVQTQFLSLTGGSEILSRTFGAGIAGDVTVKPLNSAVPSTVTLSGVKPFTGFLRNENGNLILSEGSPIPDGGFSSGLFSTSETGATNNGGTISVTATNLNIENGAVVSARTRSAFKGGDVAINVENLNITRGGQIVASALDAGTAQNIDIKATGVIDISGLDSNYNARFQQIFNAFVAEFTSQNVDLQTAQQRAFIKTQETVDPVSRYSGLQASELSGQGTAGSISISAPSIRMSDRAVIEASTNGNNLGGDIDIKAQTIALTNGSVVSTQTTGAGKSGNITVTPLNPNAASSVTLSGIAPFVGIERDLLGNPLPDGGYSTAFIVSTEDPPPRPGLTPPPATGNSGNITVNTGTLKIENGAVLSARSRSAGAGGNITANVDTLKITGGGQILVPAFRTGKAGEIEVNATGDISITGFDADLDFDNNPDNRFSRIERRLIQEKVDPTQANELARFTVDPVSRSSGLQAQALAKDGNGSGNIVVRSRDGSIFISNKADISTYTKGLGNAGDVVIEAKSGSVALDRSYIFSTVESGGVANGGNIQISTGSLLMRDGSQLQTLLRDGAKGNAGVVAVQATDTISLEGARTSILTTIEAGADGNTGDNLFAGNIFNQFFGLPGEPIGSIFLETGTLSLSNGATLNSSTYGEGNAGAVVVAATGDVSLTRGSSILSIAGGTAQNNPIAGGVLIQSSNLFIDQSTISTQTNNIPKVNSQISAGLIFVDTDSSIRLNNQGKIVATTSSGQGGDIWLFPTELLLLRRSSEISTTAGTAGAGGDGGNIRIDTRFVVSSPKENSDIKSNAFGGAGGAITVNANSIYWLAYISRQQLIQKLQDQGIDTSNPLNIDPRFLKTNDITAFSQINPNLKEQTDITVTSPDPNGLTTLLLNLVDRTQQLDSSCRPGSNQAAGSFINTGRGGLPPSPTDPLHSPPPIANWVSIDPDRPATPIIPTTRASTPPTEIIEAQGYTIAPNGDITLVAQTPTLIPHQPWSAAVTCHAPNPTAQSTP